MNVKILVVDDASFWRSILVRWLSKYKDINIQMASNGEEAVAKYKKEKPTVVFMDISMPVMDGVQAVEEIIKIDPDAKIIIITAEGGGTRIKRGIKAGAKSYLLKPIKEDKLIAEVEKIIGEKLERK